MKDPESIFNSKSFSKEKKKDFFTNLAATMTAQKTIYGTENTDFAGNLPFPADYANHREETNHLGNVLVVVSYRKIAVEDAGNPGTVEYYEADIVSAQDYYPFGMIMPGRSVSAGEYRYGFNSMEQDDEWSVTGGHLDFGARIYDSRLGRWLSVDPKFYVYPELTPYRFGRNNPLVFNDPEGEIEYQTITINFEETGHSISLTAPVSDKVMTDGVQHRHKGYFGGATFHNRNHYYDFEHETTYTFGKDGSLTKEGTHTRIMHENGSKDNSIVWFSGADAGDTRDLSKSDQSQPAGIRFTSSFSDGSGTTVIEAENMPESMNIDMLLGAMRSPSAVKNMYDRAKNVDGAVDQFNEVLDAASEYERPVKEIKAGEHLEQREKGSPSLPNDTIYQCTSCGSEHEFDSEGNKQDYDK